MFVISEGNKYSLIDFTAVTDLEEFSSSEVGLIADLCQQAVKINPDALVAIVADKDLVFGLARMWEIMMPEQGWDIMVFRTSDAAESWIKVKAKESFGISDLTFQPI